MKFFEWFDIHNTEHLQAYRDLSDTGFWPKGFILDNVEMDQSWQIPLAFKMVKTWIKRYLKTGGRRQDED